MYITYQLHVSTIATVAIIRLDAGYQRNDTDMIEQLLVLVVGKETRSLLHKVGVCVCVCLCVCANGKEPCV